MNRKVMSIALVAVIAIGGYFIFAKQGSPLITDQTKQTDLVVYTDPTSFLPSFLQCSPSELNMPSSNTKTNTLVITVFGLENGKCHYAGKLVNKKGATVQLAQDGFGVMDCKVPMRLINTNFFENDMFGPITRGYCTTTGQ